MEKVKKQEVGSLFVSYEEALELKELGFNEPCIATYDEDKEFEIQDFEQNYDTFPSHIIAAPLYQQAFRWFREKYNIHIRIEKYNETKWWANWGSWTSEIYDSYEETELACLKKLIEIVKNK